MLSSHVLEIPWAVLLLELKENGKRFVFGKLKFFMTEWLQISRFILYNSNKDDVEYYVVTTFSMCTYLRYNNVQSEKH